MRYIMIVSFLQAKAVERSQVQLLFVSTVVVELVENILYADMSHSLSTCHKACSDCIFVFLREDIEDDDDFVCVQAARLV